MISGFTYEDMSEDLPLKGGAVRRFMDENGITSVLDPKVVDFLKVKGYATPTSTLRTEKAKDRFVCLFHSGMVCDCKISCIKEGGKQ